MRVQPRKEGLTNDGCNRPGSCSDGITDFGSGSRPATAEGADGGARAANWADDNHHGCIVEALSTRDDTSSSPPGAHSSVKRQETRSRCRAAPIWFTVVEIGSTVH